MLQDDPLWFKDAIIYEVPVRAFADSDGDGIGDFRGLTEKLDYIQDLGVTAIWVLPFFPSPLRDDGYDISDYHSVNPIYGSLEDFQAFLDGAHQRGIRVIIELIVNHTSDQHPWFQRARQAPAGSPERDFYMWSDTPEKYSAARIIFKDFETSNWAWDPVAKAYYWHRFYFHQPDLNYESQDVQQAILDVVDFWLEMGVDGLRLDAVPYLYAREGTNCENLPETHAFLQRLRTHVDEQFPNRMLLAEANQWPEDAVEYYGQGNECHMDFHFPLMPRLFMALQMEDSFPIIDILQQTPHIPDNCQWALFLRNHDELTLEMVSDEDRDYMYRVYAQDPQARLNLGIRRRLSPLMGNNRRKIELMNSLLMSLPGTPVLYYGDEIGMGDNIYLGDRNGVRTPMQWSADRNAGFGRGNPQRLYAPVIVDPEYHYEAVNVEAQRQNPNSLWWWMKRLIAIRGRYKAFGRGTFEFLYPENRKVLAFTRTYAGEHILVVANLSRFVQATELDLSAFHNMVPVEIFGRVEFPPINESSYFLSLGPHSFYWFTLQPQEVSVAAPRPQFVLPTITVNGKWQNVFTKTESKTTLEATLPDYMKTCGWFGGKYRIIQSAHLNDVIPIASPKSQKPAPTETPPLTYHIALVQVDYTEGIPETYLLPLAYMEGTQESDYYRTCASHAIAQIKSKGETGILFEAVAESEFLQVPLDAIAHKTKLKGSAGEIVATQTELFQTLCGDALDSSGNVHLPAHLMRGEQTNTSVVYGDRLVFKLFRRIDEGINPDLEIGQFLTRSSLKQGIPDMAHFNPIAGALEYRRKGLDPMTLGMLQSYIPDTRDAWSYTLDTLRGFFEQVMARQVDLHEIALPPSLLTAALEAEVPDLAYETIGSYLSTAELLGQRTAELHLALFSDTRDPNFAPEPFSSFYQRSIYQYMRNLSGQVLLLLKKQLNQLPPETQHLAQMVLNQRDILLGRFRFVLDQKITAMRTRCHGNYSLKEVLYTGKDFVIIDFEGEPERPLSERRMKRSPLRDVAGMIHSLYDASRIAFLNEVESGMVREENYHLMDQWAHFIYAWTGVVFLKQYLAIIQDSKCLPQAIQELQVLLDAYLLEKAVYELGSTLNENQTQIDIQLQRLLELLQSSRMSHWKT